MRRQRDENWGSQNKEGGGKESGRRQKIEGNTSHGQVELGETIPKNQFISGFPVGWYEKSLACFGKAA